MITTDFEYITIDAGGHKYKLKPETQLRKAFCKEFIKIYKRNEKETNAQSQDIVKTLNEIVVYVLNFDPFSFVDDDLPSNYQTASATKKDNPAAVKGDGECKQLAKECKDTLELVKDISKRHKVINEATRKNYMELRKIITGRNAEELARKLYAENAIKKIRFDEVEEVRSSPYEYSNALLDTFADGLVLDDSLPVLLEHLNDCGELGSDLANKIMDDVHKDIPLAIKGTGVYHRR